MTAQTGGFGRKLRKVLHLAYAVLEDTSPFCGGICEDTCHWCGKPAPFRLDPTRKWDPKVHAIGCEAALAHGRMRELLGDTDAGDTVRKKRAR